MQKWLSRQIEQVCCTLACHTVSFAPLGEVQGGLLMNNPLGILSEETFIEKLDPLNALLVSMLAAQDGSIRPTSFA